MKPQEFEDYCRGLIGNIHGWLQPPEGGLLRQVNEGVYGRCREVRWRLLNHATGSFAVIIENQPDAELQVTLSATGVLAVCESFIRQEVIGCADEGEES